MIKSLRLLSLSLIFLAFLTSSAGASPKPVSGLVVSPAIEQINLDQSQTSDTFDASLTNNFNYPVTVQIQTSDFTALNNTGSVSFLSKTASAGNSHGLAAWLSPSLTQVALSPGGSQVIPVKISDVASLAPGGHYGAVLFKVLPSNTKLKGNTLSTNEEVSLLVFLTTASGGTQSLRLNPPSLPGLSTSLPKSLNLDFTNTGNTQISPRGLVTITNPKGKQIGSGIINIDSGLVLPGTDRLYEVKLNYSDARNLAGSYKVHIAYQASVNSRTTNFVHSFVLVNGSLIILLIIIILGVSTLVIRKTRKKSKAAEA